jgi:predicted metal-dependent peptidase
MSMTRMQKARAKMLVKHPFFATLLLSMPMVETRDIPTLATDMEKIYWNPDFVETLNDEELLTGMAHEVMHVALLHGARLGGRNPFIFNMAADYCINPVLVDSGFAPITGWLCEKKYEKMSADQVYDLLIKKADKERKEGRSGKPGEGNMPGFDKMHGETGDLLPLPGAGDPAAESRVKRNVQQRVAQAASYARMAGKLSGDLERLVNEVLDPKVPWFHVLRDYMTRTAQDDESWTRRNRRFSGTFMPSRFSQKMGPVVIVGDSSGSCYDDMEAYLAETGSIATDLCPEHIRFVWCDTHVKGEQVFEEGDTVVLHPKGFGGTDMRVGLTHVEQYDSAIVILFTDGYTPWPDVDPPYPLIVCCTTNAPVPIGEVIRI